MKNNYQKLYSSYKNNISTRESIGISLAGMLSIAIVFITIVLTGKVVYTRPYKPVEHKSEIVIVSNENITQKEINEARVRCDEWLKRENELAPQREYEERCHELAMNFTKGDYIKITWWGDNTNGAIAPKDASCTGQIKEMCGDKIKGSWGDYELQYRKAYFQRISKKEYIELREKEQRRRDRLNVKKKNGTWGVIMPGTTNDGKGERVWWDNPEVYAREKK